MTPGVSRRALLAVAAVASTPFVAGCALGFPDDSHSPPSVVQPTDPESLDGIEASSGGRLGAYAIDTGNGATLQHRADERFAFCSTFKVIVAAGLLDRSTREPGLLERRVVIAQADLVNYSPITLPRVGQEMSLDELCAAALRYSDNTAGNLLIRALGGTAAVTSFARLVGDTEFRLDRWETALNTAIPGDLRDTTTPSAMAHTLQRLTLGDVLPAAQRDHLLEWMRGNTTGNERIRAGVSATWQVADKTGTGDFGATNDMAVLVKPGHAPIVLVLFLAQSRPDAPARSDILAAATHRIAQQLASPV